MPKAIVFAALLVLATACGTVEPIEIETTTPPQETTVTEPTTSDTVAEEPLPDYGAVKALREIDGWLQADIDSLEDLRGKVVVVQFWTFGCHNCKATLDNLKGLYAALAGEDFEIVRIHSPEFA